MSEKNLVLEFRGPKNTKYLKMSSSSHSINFRPSQPTVLVLQSKKDLGPKLGSQYIFAWDFSDNWYKVGRIW